tara:strand:- start:656 stop:937 length:282 start_codon:yes stop_codon:yes gene_type:complete
MTGMILTSAISLIISDKMCVSLLEAIFDAIEEIPLKPRRTQFKLKNKYITMVSTLERRATRKKWNDSIKCVADGKAALKEILDELEKLSSWDI